MPMTATATVGVNESEQRNCFDNSVEPILTVESGDVVRFECPGPDLPPDATPDDVALLDNERPHTIVGPVSVKGARPGDTLTVEILDIEVARDFGHTIFFPGFGLRPDRFDEVYVQNWAFHGSDYSELRPGIRIPLRPFCGIMAVAPAEPGEHSTIPPRPVGGNLDVGRLTKGATLFLPVAVPGALFSCGDGHAAQGCGELCGTALETAVNVTLRLTIDQDKHLDHFAFATSAPRVSDTAGCYVTTGTGPDLYECAQRAVDRMIDHLVAHHGLTEREAYILCSVTVDLSIEQIVDAPNWCVSAALPRSIFTDQ